MEFRKATINDINAIAAIYEEIHTEEEAGRTTIGWIRKVYPTRETASAALDRDDLFVADEDGKILGAAIINQLQVDSYFGANWQYPAKESEIMVLHTLVISPTVARGGLGSKFVRFYESYARECGCYYLRMDTNARNLAARNLYRKLSYQEIDIVPCEFNGIKGVNLVLLEKKL